MVNAQSEIQRIIIDVSDPQITKVKIETKLSGDYPIGMKSVYEKSFPARMSAVDILQNEVKDYLFW